MVERRADGGLYPYVMDFGLAREVTAPGQTLGGTIEGTPAFMSPEQARGEIQGLDRRTDVYSLGATLYDLLAGAPPFAGESGAQILLTVLLDEARPLRQRVRTIPIDLETVVMKCLEKEPARRYDSAKALADELGRYLAGEPIAARQQSVGYRGWKLLRRHKVLAATIAVATCCLLLVSGLLVRAQLQTAAEARFAQQLGQEVKELELFLRLAYTMPLHDVGREVARTRVRMGALARRLPELRPAAAARAHYALGRGHLALHEYDDARQHLEAALAQGDQAPEVHAALGHVLGEQYRKQLADAQRGGDKAWLKGRQDELARQYLVPARAHLVLGRDAPLESTAYAEGLLSFYSQHYEEALRKAAEAAQQAPWLYEVRKLEGDIHTAIAQAHKSRGEYAPAKAAFRQAATAYQAARDFARSDASVYEAEAEMCIGQMELEKNQGQSIEQSFLCAITACDKARIAAPTLAGPQEKRVWAYFHLTDSQQIAGHDPRPSVEKITHELSLQTQPGPRSALFNSSLGDLFLTQALYEQSHGIDCYDSVTLARKYHQAALEIDAKFIWSWSGLAIAAVVAAQRNSLHGQYNRDAADSVISYFLKSYEIDNNYTDSLITMICSISWLAELDLENGSNPREIIKTAEEASQKLVALNKSDYNLIINLAIINITKAKYLFFVGGKEAALLSTARHRIDLALQLQPNNPEASRTSAEAYRLGALAAERRGEDPSAQIALGLTAAARAIELSPADPTAHQLAAQLHLLAADWDVRRKASAAAQLKLARGAAERARALDQLAAESYLRLAEVAWREASERQLQHQDATLVITQGLDYVDQALVINPRLGRAFAARAALLWRKAGAAARPAERATLEQAAAAALRQALTLNRFLQRENAELAMALGVTITVDRAETEAPGAQPD